jgi:hypothetical protein
MTPGDAFYLNVINSHRYFVLHSAINPSEKILVFNFTTHCSGECDETCIILPSEYSGLRRDSVVLYSRGLLLEGHELSNFKAAIGTPLPHIGDAILERIKRGAITSIHTPKKIKTFLAPSS